MADFFPVAKRLLQHWFENQDHLYGYGERIIVRKIDDAFCGYPRLAAFVDSDPNFMIYRRFGYLRTRLLLYHQDVIREIENQLDLLDENSFSSAETQAELCCRMRDDNTSHRARRNLFKELEPQLKAYDDLLLRSAHLYQLDPPQSRNQNNVYGAIWNDGQLREPDRDYIKHADDLITLGGDKEHSWVHGIFETLCTKASRKLSRKLFQTKVQAMKTKDPRLAIDLYSKPRFDRVVATFYTLIITVLLLAPVFVLSNFQDQMAVQSQVANTTTSSLTEKAALRSDYLIVAFVTGFALLCSTCTTAKRHEIFAATAAYCAVLVVFIGQNNNIS